MQHFLRRWLHQIIASLLCIAAVLLTMPRETGFGYAYSLDEPWRYAPLIATFEFPIHKSESQLKAERDSALRAFQPYCQLRTAVGEQQIKNFKSDYAQGLFHGVPDSHVAQAMKMLTEVYREGLIDADILNRLVAEKRVGVRIVEGTSATSKPISTLFSPRTAYEYMMNSDARFSREILARLNLHQYLQPNLIYDTHRSQEGERDALKDVSLATGMVLAGERIIDRGERVSPRQLAILDSLRQESERRKADSKALTLIFYGQLGLVVALIASLFWFLALFRPHILRNPRAVYLILTLVGALPLLSSVFLTAKVFSIYVIPFVMLPIVLRVFIDTRTAFVSHMIMVLLASIPLHTPYPFVLVQLFAGMMAIYTTKELTERSQIIRTAALVTLFSIGLYFCFDLAQGASLNDLNRDWYLHILISGVALLFIYPLFHILERIFGFTSNVTLIELSNSNHVLLRRMAKEAQGTFVHSMQVANLAVEVGSKLGARVHLLRTGALFHDIGKMYAPGYFTENQGGINPHDELSEEESAQKIIAHVTEGLKMADKYGLPRVVRDFIDTHHGELMVKYFYIQACNRLGEENVDKAKFTYPGRNPSTLEQGILMMADSVEAASRSLPEYSDENITALVHRIVDGQQAAGAFNNCPISLKDITEAKETLINSLKVIYHTRIAYPERKKTEEAQEPSSTFKQQWLLWKKK